MGKDERDVKRVLKRCVFAEDFLDFGIDLCELLLAEGNEFLGLFQIVSQRVNVHLPAFDFVDDAFEAGHSFSIGKFFIFHE